MPDSTDFRFGMTPGLVAMAALLVGVILYQQVPAPTAAVSSPSQETATGSSPEPPIPSPAGSSRAAARLLADFLDVGIVPQEILEAARAVRNHLAGGAVEGRAQERQAFEAMETAMRWLASLQVSAAGEQKEDRLQENVISVLEGYRPPAGTRHAAVQKDLTKVLRYLREQSTFVAESTSDQMEPRHLWSSARKRGISRVSLVVATIPDYVDSNSGWTADQNLDAIQRAAAALGYQFDRFYLPDWRPSAGQGWADSGRRLHEVEPGVLLFRRVEKPVGREVHLLVVFLVAETPTAGIQHRAFQRAVCTVRQWSRAAMDEGLAGLGADGSLLVLGPTFSGSSLSLRYALEANVPCAAETPLKKINIVSGTATNPNNRDLLTFGEAEFSATVHTDDKLLEALGWYLCRLKPELREGSKIAFLRESNTYYGATFAPKKERPNAAPSQNQASGDKPQETAFSNANVFEQAIYLSFPLHISRLRSMAGASRSVSALPTAPLSPNVAIRMEQHPAGRDYLPALTPEMTSATVELTLANILDTIRRERVSAVGIFTTDKRDYLFLSRQIIRAAPNVLLFTTEGDLLFIHPDFGSFVRGTIVASSYPLFAGTQWLTNPSLAKLGIQQFPTMGAQGIYNAMLKLLGREDLRIDYPPGNASGNGGAAVPPVWISVVGKDALWPIAIYPGKSGSSSSAPLAPALPVPGKSGAEREHKPRVPPLAWLLFVLVTIAALGHGLAYLLSFVSPPHRFKGKFGVLGVWVHSLREKLQDWAKNEVPLARLFDFRRACLVQADRFEEPLGIERSRFLLICFSTLGLLDLWMLSLMTVWRWDRFPETWGLWSLLLIAFILIVVLGFVATLVDRASIARRIIDRRRPLRSLWEKRSDPGLRHFVLATCTALLMGLPAVFAGGALLELYGEVSDFSAFEAQLLFVRTVNVGNWVSQAPVVLFAAAALYIWALWTACQLSMRGDRYEGESGLFRMLAGVEAGEAKPEGSRAAAKSRREAPQSELAAVLASPWRRTRPWLLASVLGVVSLYGFFAWQSGYGIDGLAFSRFAWWATLLLVFVFVHSLSQTVHLALILARSLRGLGMHPIGPAFRRVADNAHFNWRLSARPSRARHLMPALGLLKVLRAQLGDRTAQGEPSTPESEALSAEIQIEKLDGAALALEREPDVAFLRNEAWPVLVAVGAHVQRLLTVHFWHRPRQKKDESLVATCEELLALEASFVIRDMLSRIVTGLTVAMAVALMILGSHLFYPFQGRYLIVWLDLILIGVLALIGVAILVHFDRDRILSWSWSTTPGRLNWTGGFFPRLIVWLAVILLTVLAARFPELGENMRAWVDPLRKALP